MIPTSNLHLLFTTVDISEKLSCANTSVNIFLLQIVYFQHVRLYVKHLEYFTVVYLYWML